MISVKRNDAVAPEVATTMVMQISYEKKLKTAAATAT